MNWYKIAKEILFPNDSKSLKKIVEKMMKGNRDWTPEELQLYQNYPDIIEEMLRKLA